MERFTQDELVTRYTNFKERIPGVWKTELMAVLNLRQDLENIDETITNNELINIIKDVLSYDPIFFKSKLENKQIRKYTSDTIKNILDEIKK